MEDDSIFFIPEGTYHIMDDAHEAIYSEGYTSVALKGKDCAVVASQKINRDKSHDPESDSNIYRLSRQIACVTTGCLADCHYLVQHGLLRSSQHNRDYMDEIGIDALREFLADICHIHTQHNSMRPLACTMMLISYTKVLGPSVFKVEPGGNYSTHYACASGHNMFEANSYLRQYYQSNLPKNKVVELAVNCLASISEETFRINDIEVGIINERWPEFHKLNMTEIRACMPKNDRISNSKE